MCGICGVYLPGRAKTIDLRSMQNAIIHRGPDDEGAYVDDSVALGVRRLSIIDISGGKMPISNEDETIWIVFNGEIYNFKTLRQELIEKGHRFKSKADTEVIVHLYEEYGTKCLEKLEGMFAFAIWDKTKKELFLARDRIGQKPLYYSSQSGAFLFGSELKCILAVNHFSPTLNFRSLHHYLSLRFIPSPDTMFNEIQKLPPGHYMTVKEGKIQVNRYWDLFFEENGRLTEADYIEGLKSHIDRAVISHTVSDVPVGAFLSGGLDSSTIVATMSQNTHESFKTFSIGVAENDFNEIPYARIVASHYQTDQIERVIDFNLLGTLPKLIWHLDEPSDPITACWFEAAKLASEHVKVVLGGDGGDELFAGFDRYLGMQKIKMFSRLPGFGKSFLNFVVSNMPENFSYKSFTQKLRWLNSVLSFNELAEQYAEANFFFRFNHADKENLYTESFWREYADDHSSEIFKHYFNKPNANNLLDKMIYFDIMTRLSEHTLMMTDRLNMAQSLEARSPFLDHHLIEFVASVPVDLKIRKGSLKYLLKESMKGKLPENIINREKQGFMFPLAYWFRNELYPGVKKILSDSFFIRDGLFRKDSVMQLIENHKQNRVDNHVRIWMLMNLELWHQIYIERKTLEEVGESINRSFYVKGG